MRALLAVLVLLLLSPGALADGAVWTGKKVRVYDFTSPAWGSVIVQTVSDLNAMLPKKAPRLVYRRMTERPCSQAPQRKGAIVVCLLHPTDSTSARAAWWTHRHVISWAQVRLSPTTAPDNYRKEACHEFLHATTGIRDSYGAAPETSCV